MLGKDAARYTYDDIFEDTLASLHHPYLNISHRLGTQVPQPELMAQMGSRADVAETVDAVKVASALRRAASGDN